MTQASSPTLVLPGTIPIPAVAPVYVDGIPVVSAGTAASGLPSQSRFWSSQPRLPGDPAQEQLTITLGASRTINYISLAIAHFPCRVLAWWWDGAGWQPVLTPSGSPLSFVVTGSVPAVVSSPAALTAGLSPYHYGAGHWERYDEPVQPLTTTQILIQAGRPSPGNLATGSFPVGPTGALEPYPVGIKDLDFGFRIAGPADVPYTPRDPQSLTQRQPFTTTTDVNGNPAQVVIRENRASDLLRGLTWRSAPQPRSDAVVNLYVDARAPGGDPQLIDRFYIDPVTSGPRINLYYSPVPPPAGTGFPALDDPLAPSLLSAGGAQLPAAGTQGITFPRLPGWLTVGNQGAAVSSSDPWWAAAEIQPQSSSTSSGSYVIADSGIMQLSWSQGAWSVTVPAGRASSHPGQPSGGLLASWAFPFSAGDRLQFVFGFDGAHIFAWSPRGGLAVIPASPPFPGSSSLRFGATLDAGDSAWPGFFTLGAFVLKQQQVDLSEGVPADFPLFAADATGYVSPPLDSSPATQDAVIRFSPAFILGTTSPWGFTGGLGSAYLSCAWIPVLRDFALARGYLEFDPVLAAAFRFEFTSLTPEPFDYYQAVPAPAQFFPPGSLLTTAQANPGTPAQVDPGLEVTQNLAPTIVFSDTPLPRPPSDPAQAMPTEALYATEPAAAAQLAEGGGSLYNFHPWQPQPVTPGPSTGTEGYQVLNLAPTGRVAYFAAVSSLVMGKVDFTAADDTERYNETFLDTSGIDPRSLVPPGTWQWQPGIVSVPPGAGPVTLQGKILASAHQVTAVQFSTAQTPPRQLLDDPGFADTTLASWGPVGDALPLQIADVSAQLGNMVLVQRGPGAVQLDITDPPYSWAFLQNAYGTWADLEQQFRTWADFTQPVVTISQSMGGMQFTGPPVATTAAGRVYIAARVFSPVALTAPLVLQLLDGATGIVIGEAEIAVTGGTVTEWFAGFTLGTSQYTFTPLDWAQVEAAYPTWADIDGIPWSQVDLSVAVTPLGQTIGARLVQQQATSDNWYVDDLSVFEDVLVWEFSSDAGASWWPAYDIRGNPHGALVFPPPGQGAGNQLTWRVTGYQPGAKVAQLVIRPWYVTWPRGILPRPAGAGHGPNLSPLDQYDFTASDPWWQLPFSPIPADWFFTARQSLQIGPRTVVLPVSGPPPPVIAVSGDLASAPGETPAVPEWTYTDIFTDVFTSVFAPADGGDVFTDVFSEGFGQDYLVTTGTVHTATASLFAPGSLSATAAVTALLRPALGAGLGAVPGTGTPIDSWLHVLPLPVRRVAFGNQIPAALAGSLIASDAGVRRLSLDFRPDASTTPSQLAAFLASCQAGGVTDATVSLWAGMDQCFLDPHDYLATVHAYIAAIRQNGYQHAFVMSNDSVTAGALETWYPGDDLVDVLMPTFYCAGPAPGSGAPTLALAIQFAAQHRLLFGLAAFGADPSEVTEAQGVAFLLYVLAVAVPAAGQDLIADGSGDYAVASLPLAWRALLSQIARALPGS